MSHRDFTEVGTGWRFQGFWERISEMRLCEGINFFTSCIILYQIVSLDWGASYKGESVEIIFSGG